MLHQLPQALLIIALFTSGCGSIQRAAMDVPPDAPGVIIDQRFDYDARTAPFSITFVEQRGDFFVFSVSYSGGCETHAFDLVSRGDFTATYPPEVRIKLKHDDLGDRCRGRVEENRYFDMTNLKYQGTNRVRLILTNTNETYDFNY